MIALEAFTNAAIGLCVSYALTLWWLGFNPVQSATITAVFFAASFARGYAVRLIFKRFT
jgi:hypothetical protein